MKKSLLFIAFVFITCSELYAQQLPVLDNYLINPVSLSPSFAGLISPFQVYLTYRSSWTGLSGAPKVGYLSADGNVGKNMGVGGSLMVNQAGIFKNFALNLNYAYHLKLAESHTLSFGVNAAVYQNSLDISEAIVSNPQDPVLAGRDKLTETYVNAGFSMLYSWKELYFCFGFPLILNNRSLYSITDTNHVLGLARNWVLYGSYTIVFNTPWKLKFDLLYRGTQFSPWTLDFSAMVKYQDSYWLGAFYRKNNIIGITAGFSIVKSLIINYNYEYSGFSMNGQSFGNHEFTLGYRLPVPEKKAPELKDYNKCY